MASVWKDWRPDLIFREFFADQNEVNFRDMKGTAASVWKDWRPRFELVNCNIGTTGGAVE